MRVRCLSIPSVVELVPPETLLRGTMKGVPVLELRD